MQERELRLREYMRVLGMLDAAYWGSWFATHMIILMVSGVLCAYIGQCASISSSALADSLAVTSLFAATTWKKYCISGSDYQGRRREKQTPDLSAK